MVIYYADDKDPNAWKKDVTWDETPIMSKAYRPVSFILNRPLKRPEPVNPPVTVAQPKPMSLPPVNYLPPPRKRHRIPGVEAYDNLIMRIDGVPHLEIDGDFVTIEAERHSGRLSQYPRAIPEPGVNKKPRGRTVPTKESGEREGTTYTCRVCRKAFTRSEHMKRHIRSLHMHMEGTYMCSLPFCKKSFARRDNLIQHERKHKQLGAFHDCTKNFEGEIFPSLLPFYASREHRADLNVVINETDAYFEEWENKSIEWPAERPKSYGRLASASPLCDDDGIPKGERYRIMREEKVVAEVLAATEAEAEARKADLEKALLGQPPAIGTSRSMPLRSKPVFPTDFYYGEVVPGRSTK